MTWEEYFNGLTERERPLALAYKEIIEEAKPVTALEVGSGWGIFAFNLLHNSEARLTTIDRADIDARPDFNRRTAGLEDRIERIVADSMNALPEMANKGLKFDLVFIDGGHDFEHCLADLEQGWKLLSPGGLLLIDDIFHKNNYKFDENLEHDYGVGQALWSFATENLEPGHRVQMFTVGSGGLALIQKSV